ncbi:hypothetical protein N8H71_00625 [Pseudomonas koreensis]|uniref:hypothetical protein n=1 Tax=Pseudomonas koreensis TaxID=198620 RepID=UPI0021C77606|nr:hypothetical protein [Pseudomonas koreensis]MCU0070070.1 hypothetical protein [Pseudomonas koreensis]
MKIFTLKSNTRDYSSFIEDYPADQQSIISRAMAQQWKPFDESIEPVRLILTASDSGKKNFQFDVSCALFPFVIFSEDAVEALSEHFLAEHGQFLPVITESKRKSFSGYFPIDPVKKCLDMERSKYREYPNGLLVEKAVLVAQHLPERNMFVIEEDIKRIFVTERFKEQVEQSGLKGFDFSNEIEVV